MKASMLSVPEPFVGLRPFDKADAHLFFGRDTQVDDLLSRLRTQRFVVVMGTSGSGKSSLVRAGVMPRLRRAGADDGAYAAWVIVPPVMGVVVGAVATRIGSASPRPPGRFWSGIAPAWPWFLVAALVGYLGLMPGVVLAGAWGIASEALNLGTEWAFRDHDVVRVQLVTHLENEPSQRVARRCGFRREGVLRAWEPVKDDQPDVVMWSRLATDPAPDLGHA